MTKFYTKSYTGFRLLREITLVLAVICGSLAGVKALDASVYAVKSRLAAGTCYFRGYAFHPGRHIEVVGLL